MAALTVLPEEMWDVQDDLCDCMYQRIGMWTNPYLAETLEVRMCCIWKELYQLFPQYVRVTPAFLDYNRNEWQTELMEWNAEFDMPPAIWYRQLAKKEGITVGEARAKYAELDHLRPRGVPRPQPEPEEEAPNPTAFLFEMVTGLAKMVAELKGQVDGITGGLDGTGMASLQPGEDPDLDGEEAGYPGSFDPGTGTLAPGGAGESWLAGLPGLNSD